ncbi:MAG TPA: fumarylacetoacetase [Steroidobacteraceae bacterium]
MSKLDHTHDVSASSWVDGADGHRDFPIQNLPLGVFSVPGETARIGVAIGNSILDLRSAQQAGLVEHLPTTALGSDSLNELFSLDSGKRLQLRQRLFELLSRTDMALAVRQHLHAADQCKLHLPMRVGDYTDFYAGIHHALNIGRQLRPDNPLLPNYKHVPIAYHGRASSVVVSGASVQRPNGQRKSPEADTPDFGPSRRLDYELELGVWIAGENALGTAVPIADAAARIAGLCLLNDWSARDIQAWEYQPLGPFLAKNFLTTVSAWIMTAEALAPFRIAQPARPSGDPAPLSYLWDETDQAQGAFSIGLEVRLSTRAMRAADLEPHLLSAGSTSALYWTAAQMVTHHCCGGCNLRSGDLLGTGTISGPDPSSYGSLMEITRSGRDPIQLPNGETRGFLESGDQVILSGQARA